MHDTIFISDLEGTKKYYFNAIKRISNNTSVTLTKYNTSEGTPISDNAYREPYEISMEFISSELNKSKNIVEDELSQIYTTDSNTLKDIFFNWKDNFTRLVIQTRHFRYENMVINSIRWNDDNETLGVFNPTIRFSECRVAKIQTTTLGPFNDNETQSSLTTEVNKGNNSGNIIGDVINGIVSVTTGAGAGALVSAGIGSVFGPAGTIIGGIVGGIAGAIYSAGRTFKWW